MECISNENPIVFVHLTVFIPINLTFIVKTADDWAVPNLETLTLFSTDVTISFHIYCFIVIRYSPQMY